MDITSIQWNGVVRPAHGRLNVLRLQSVVLQPIYQNRPINQSTCTLGRFFGRQSVYVCRHLRKFEMPKCRPTNDRHNKQSAENRTMIEGWSRDDSMTVSSKEIGHRRRNQYNIAQLMQNWLTDKREVHFGQDNSW